MVTIVVDLTAEGRKLPEPSRERPVIYFPVTAGGVDVDDTPPKRTVQRWLVEALAEQGYLPISPEADQASQLLVFQWGAIDPKIEEMDFSVDEENPLMGQTFWNERELLDLLAGKSANQPMPSWKREKMRNEAVAGRYFVRLLAYDYEAAKKKQKKLLWHARVSTYSDGATLSDVLPTLIKAGGPHFGRATKRPVVVALPIGRAATVELGESAVKEYLPPTGTKEE